MVWWLVLLLSLLKRYVSSKPSQINYVQNYDDIMVSFANDVNLAKDVYNYLSSNPDISNSNIVMNLAKDEICVSKNISNDQKKVKHVIKNILSNYLKSHANLTKFTIMGFENLIVVGIPKNMEKISKLKSCEICGYGVTTQEELLVHRRAH